MWMEQGKQGMFFDFNLNSTGEFFYFKFGYRVNYFSLYWSKEKLNWNPLFIWGPFSPLPFYPEFASIFSKTFSNLLYFSQTFDNILRSWVHWLMDNHYQVQYLKRKLREKTKGIFNCHTPKLEIFLSAGFSHKD